MRWYVIVALVCMVIAPFDALYMHIKANRRREELRRREGGDAARPVRREPKREEDDA